MCDLTGQGITTAVHVALTRWARAKQAGRLGGCGTGVGRCKGRWIATLNWHEEQSTLRCWVWYSVIRTPYSVQCIKFQIKSGR